MLHGGSALPHVQFHLQSGEQEEAAAVARLALSNEPCADAEEIERILDQCGDPPDEWTDIFDEFAEAPSVERWKSSCASCPATFSTTACATESAICASAASTATCSSSAHVPSVSPESPPVSRDDFLGAVRLLRESKACETEWCPVFPHIFFVRERASASELEALDRAGLTADLV